MNHRYNLKEIFELIVTAEKSLSQFINSKDNESWPLTRLVIWRILILNNSKEEVRSIKEEVKNEEVGAKVNIAK